MASAVMRLLRRMLTRGRLAEPADAAGKRVWRISDATPQGEWVDPKAPATALPEPEASSPPETHASGWMTSSMDLLGGAEIVELPDDAAPPTRRDPP